METRDLASNLEFWSGRGRTNGGDDPDRKRPSFGPSRFRRRWLRVSSFARPSFARPSFARPSLRLRSFQVTDFPWRPTAAAALIAGLTVAWLIVGQHASSSPAAPARTAAPDTTRSSVARGAPATTVPVTPDCRGLSPARREVRCVIDAIDVDIRMVSAAAVGAAYRRAAGADVAAREGSPACAHGVPDERAWSVASAPINAIGRYRCRFEHGLAAMWWTHGDRLVHAVAPDGDLAALFSWWQSHQPD